MKLKDVKVGMKLRHTESKKWFPYCDYKEYMMIVTEINFPEGKVIVRFEGVVKSGGPKCNEPWELCETNNPKRYRWRQLNKVYQVYNWIKL